MVILSALLAEKSYRKYKNKGFTSVREYYFSRIKRLVIPTWIFLTVYFLLFALFSGKLHSVKYYIASYCLTRYGIGYVWVILIYLYSAMLVPLFSNMMISIKSVLLIAVLFLLYEVAFYFQIGTANKFIDTTFYYIVPYGLLTFLGYNYNKTNPKLRWLIIISSLLIFALFFSYYWVVTGSPQSVQIAKYPPRAYYLSYGIMWSFALIWFCEKYNFKIYAHPMIKFISTHSMWIYLWHIMALSVYSALNLPEIWILKLIVVYTLATLTVYLVNVILDWLEKKIPIGAFKYLRG